MRTDWRSPAIRLIAKILSRCVPWDPSWCARRTLPGTSNRKPSTVYQHWATERVALASVRSPLWLIWKSPQGSPAMLPVRVARSW